MFILGIFEIIFIESNDFKKKLKSIIYYILIFISAILILKLVTDW